MIPYVVTIIVLIITSVRSKRENQPPQASACRISARNGDAGRCKLNPSSPAFCAPGCLLPCAPFFGGLCGGENTSQPANPFADKESF